MDSTCSQSRVRSPFTPSNCNHITANCKRKTIKQVESLAGELIASLKGINSQGPDFVHAPKIPSSAPASECRKIDNNSPTAGSDNTKDSTTNNTKDFHCPSTRKREQNRAWNLIYENFQQGKFRTSPAHHIEQLRKPATCEPRAKEEMIETPEKMGTSLQGAEWADEYLRRAELEDESTEQERIELARDLAVIDYFDDELDSESDTDSDDEDDFPHMYADIPFSSRTPTDNDDDNDSSLLLSRTATQPGNMSPAGDTGIASTTSKALLDLIKGPLTPPDTPILIFSQPKSSPSSIFNNGMYNLEPENSSEISKFDTKREFTLITALINDLGQRLITYQELTDNVFVAALYNADPAPELLSLKSFCAWTLHPISDQMKDTLPPPTQTVPDLRLINSDGEVYSLEERMEILDEFEDRDFARHLAQRDEWQEDKERWFLRKCTATENEARLQHLERWYEEGLAM